MNLLPTPHLDYSFNGKWKLLDAYSYKDVTVPAGEVTDLDSVPRLPFAYMLTKSATVIGAIIHDHLYRTGKRSGKVITRKEADDLFNEVMVAEGVKDWQRLMIYTGVRVGGWRPWNKYRRGWIDNTGQAG